MAGRAPVSTGAGDEALRGKVLLPHICVSLKYSLCRFNSLLPLWSQSYPSPGCPAKMHWETNCKGQMDQEPSFLYLLILSEDICHPEAEAGGEEAHLA